MTVGISYIAYSRADKCKETLSALCTCEGIEKYDIHVFSDAPHNEKIKKQVQEVRYFLHQFANTHSVPVLYLHEAQVNKGSFENISSALKEMSKVYDYVILVEEDVLVGKSFLNYMISAIHFYKDCPSVYALSGYNPVPDLDLTGDAFLSERLCCYGLCMKSSDIQDIEWDINKLDLRKINKKKFYHIAKDISACFDDDVHGYRDFTTSWDIVLYYNMLLNGKWQVLPKVSYCTNIGFDGSGEWSSAGGFKNDNFIKNFSQKVFRFEKDPGISSKEYERFLKGFIQDSPKKDIIADGEEGLLFSSYITVGQSCEKQVFEINMNIVLSGINLFSGGTLEIYRDTLLEIIEAGIDKKNKITAFVYDRALFADIIGNIQFIEIKKAKKSYLHRLYYEYIYFYKWSCKRKSDIWIAMHDLSPNVAAKYRYTYFQSAQIFYKMPAAKIKYDPRCFVMSKLYKYLIRINCRKIDAFVVQANWIRGRMNQMFCPRNVMVHNPDAGHALDVKDYPPFQHSKMRFIYPAFPRVFKNFEIICEASKLLQKKYINNYEVIFTITGDENSYAKSLYRKYKEDRRLKWIGPQDYKHLLQIYQTADALIFSSELETWGLPITELGSLGKLLILADQEYAHESSAYYTKTDFFRNSRELSVIMAEKIDAFHTKKYDFKENDGSALKQTKPGLAEHILQILESE